MLLPAVYNKQLEKKKMNCTRGLSENNRLDPQSHSDTTHSLGGAMDKSNT